MVEYLTINNVQVKISHLRRVKSFGPRDTGQSAGNYYLLYMGEFDALQAEIEDFGKKMTNAEWAGLKERLMLLDLKRGDENHLGMLRVVREEVRALVQER